MGQRIEGGTRGVPEITEQGVRILMARTSTFLRANPQLFTVGSVFCDPIDRADAEKRKRLLGEASDLLKQLNFAGKAMIRQGGKVPALLQELHTLNERVELIVRPDSAYGHEYQELAKGDLAGITRLRHNVNQASWLALRSTTQSQRLKRPDMTLAELENYRGEPVEAERFNTYNVRDVLHLKFNQLGARDPRQSDLGWVASDFTNANARALVRDRHEKMVEGFIWDGERVAEVVRRKAGYKLPGNLSLITGESGNRLVRGFEPRFFDGRIKFSDPTKIEQQIRDNVGLVVEFLMNELEGKNTDDFVRGGRPGLNPSRLYLDR
ncbi:MAG: hypothetical protein AAB373_06385 [Patescibacteria group bacterium]